MDEQNDPTVETESKGTDGRREFLKKCGKFAVITPPAVSFLLSTTLSSKAIAASGGGGGSNGGSRPGWGYGDSDHVHSGPPGLTNSNRGGLASPGADTRGGPGAGHGRH